MTLMELLKGLGSLLVLVLGHFFGERHGRCVLWVAVHPNPWRLEFSEHAVVQWRLQHQAGRQSVFLQSIPLSDAVRNDSFISKFENPS